jgi:hypothetical protein
MRLYHPDGVRMNIGTGVNTGQKSSLTLNTRSEKTLLFATVIVDTAGDYDTMNCISVRYSIREAL